MATFFGIPLPGLSGFRDPTQQQIAQLQGVAPADPYAEQGWQPFSPGAARWNAAGSALTNLGAGLLSGRNWSEGLSRGLLAASQGFQDGMKNARRGYDVEQQGRSMQRRIQQEDRATAREDEAAARRQAAIDAAAANPPPGVDPQQWRAMIAVDPAGTLGAYGKSRFDQVDAPRAVGGMMWDGKQQTYVPTSGDTEQQPRIAAAGRTPAAPAGQNGGSVESTNVMNDKGQMQSYIKGSAEADAAVRTPGSPIVGTTLTDSGAKVGDQQRRAQILYSLVQPEAATLTKTWPALSSSLQQGFAAGGKATNWMQSGDYQRARNSIRTIVASWLFASSGAPPNPGVVEAEADALMPEFGDDAATIADKQRRVQIYIDGIGQMAAAAEQGGQGGQPGAAPPAAANSDPLEIR